MIADFLKFQSEIVQENDKSWIILVKMARKLEKDKIASMTNKVKV